ncbi:MAG: hypothetical protein AMXMBFR64_62820 [Myxococcales bacterium]
MSRNWVALLSMALVALYGAAGAEVPKDTATLKIDHIDGKKGAVTFEHAKHASEYKKADGSAIACIECHHTTRDPAETRACIHCHVKAGERQVDYGGTLVIPVAVEKAGAVDQRSVIFHTQCIACHKQVEGKKLTACKTCH